MHVIVILSKRAIICQFVIANVLSILKAACVYCEIKLQPLPQLVMFAPSNIQSKFSVWSVHHYHIS